MRFWTPMAVLATALLASSAQAQTMYRCGSTFSQTPCGSDAKSVRVSPSDLSSDTVAKQAVLAAQKQPAPSQEVIAANIETCERRIRTAMKDPDAARISEGARGGPSVEYEDGRSYPVVRYFFKVNGKNGYGGYVGDKLYVCVYDLGEKRIVRIRESGAYPSF